MNHSIPEEKYIDLNGQRFYYLDWGNHSCQSMLLLHGFMAHSRIWDDFAENIKDRYHILALDQRGHGKSQWSNNSSYTIDDHFVDIVNFVEALDLDNLILMGHSMGGRNALLYVACQPVRVNSLILVDARPGNNPESADTLKQHIAELPIEAMSIGDVVQVINRLYPYMPSDLSHYIAEHGYRQKDGLEYIPEYDADMSRYIEEAGYAVEELWPFMENVSCPTMIVRGEESTFLSLDDAQNMCNAIPKAVLKEIPKSSHMPLLENRDAFIKVIIDFLEGL